MFQAFRRGLTVLVSTCFGVVFAGCAQAAPPVTQNVVRTYSDLIDLAESTPLVIHVEVKDAAKLDPPQAGAVAPGMARIYVESRGINAIFGTMPAAPLLRYLADVPLDSRGKLPSQKKLGMILFARPAPAGNGEIQLVARDGQLPWSPELEDRIRKVLAELNSPTAPPRITGISMAYYQQGDLVGEGESQFFLTTANGSPAAIVVQHKAGQPAHWTASFSEVVDASGKPPEKDTLAWYRLACSLPATLPSGVDVSESQDAKDQAQADYLLVRRDLGVCERNRGK